jgi:hypothetical protein
LAAQPGLGLLPKWGPGPSGSNPSSFVASWKNLKKLAQVQESIAGNKEPYVFIFLFAILLFAWLGGFLVFHVSGFLIHLLLLFAVISLIAHLFRRKTAS